jgi:heme/copper-type cytochrome/quinol oxidase subunit 2
MFKDLIATTLLRLKVFAITIILLIIASILLVVIALFIAIILPFANIKKSNKDNNVYYEMYIKGTKVAHVPTFQTFITKIAEG